jgi:hypothetical protein
MKKATLWLLALALVIAPVAFAANDKANDKKPSDTAKTSAGDAAKNDAKPANSAPSNAEVIAELEQMRVLMKEQSDQIAQQQRQLAAMQAKLDAANTAPGAPAPSVKSPAAPASNGTPSTAIGETAAMSPSPSPVAGRQEADRKESPLSFRIGAAEFTPGGFVDFQNVFRTTNASNNGGNPGNPSGTVFGNIPFSNTVQGHLTEYRATGQNSRFNLKTHATFGKNDITGYLEFDFNGNDATNVFVTANSHTDRLRLYWLDLKRGKWEFLGGQTWGLMTPNRVGVSPMPNDLSLTLNEDANYQVGLPLTRAAEFRVAYHPNEHWALAAGIENPEQYLATGEVILPFQFNAALGVQFDAGSNNPNAPNVAPDVVTKVAYDSNPWDRHFHVEAGGLMTTVKVTDVPVGGITFVSHSKVGGGIAGAVDLELFKNFHFVANALWGNGVGRYLMGLGPQTVINPIQLGPTAFDLNPSLVHAAGGTGGFEAKVWNNTQIGAYYGAVYFQRNAPCDVTSPIITGPCPGGKPVIGFGGINSPNTANRVIHEGTVDWTQTMWGSEQHGKLLLVLQGSYVSRAPWFVAAGAPKNAHLFMSFVSLRYVLP